jgi:poly(A) polymerase
MPADPPARPDPIRLPPARDDSPLGQLPPQPWMEAPETRAVVAALTRDGAEIRFVGGCVRDALLKRPIHDIDIATPDPPDQVLRLLAQAGLTALPTGIAHGTVTAVVGTAHIEITTLREDVATFGRHARVAYTADWAADARRRDFTMNTLFADPQGRIYDPCDGLADLGAGIVRFVGRPEQRIEEDVLRLLRFFRFFAHYGRPPMDRAALAACRRLAPKLATLSGERIAGEVLRLLRAPDPGSVLIVMGAEGVLAPILPEARAFGRLKALAWLESRAMARADVTPDPLRRLGALLDADAASVQARAARLRLSRQQTQRLVALAAPAAAIGPDTSPRDIRLALRRLGAPLVRDLALIAWADRRSRGAGLGSAESARWIALLDAIRDWVPVALPVRGRDVLDLGLGHGPAVGRLLAAVERWWEERDYQPDRAACLERLRGLVKIEMETGTK